MSTFIYVQALVHLDGTATFFPCELLELSDEVDAAANGDRFALTLRDSVGNTLETCHTDVVSPCHPQDQLVQVVSGLLRANPEMATATISRDGVELASIDLSTDVPHVELISAPVDGEEVSGRRIIEWRSSTNDDSMVGHGLWYRSDDDQDWLPITLGLTTNTTDVDFDALPGGDQAVLRVTATSGASVATATSGSFKVPTPHARCTVLAPHPGATVAPGVPIPALATVHDWRDGEGTDLEHVQWRSDRDGDLGSGPQRSLILHAIGLHKIVVEAKASSGAVSAETSVTVRRPGSAFLHRTEPGNITGNSTVVSHPMLDGRAEALMQVTAIAPEHDAALEHGHGAVGVWYDGQRWNIFAQDLTEMTVDRAFVVDVNEPGPNLFVSAGASFDNSSRVEHPFCDGDPDALLLVTANWNPNGHDGSYNDAHMGVWYDQSIGRWNVFNQGRQPMPASAAFNVEVLRAGDGVWVHRATESNTSDGRTFLDDAALNGNPGAMLCVTPNWNPSAAAAGVYDDHAIGATFDPQKGGWAIAHLDATPIPLGCSFNIAVTA